MPRVYVGSGIALKHTGQDTQIQHGSFTCIAASNEDANAWALTMLRTRYAVENGYSHHQVVMTLMPDAEIEAIVRSARGSLAV